MSTETPQTNETGTVPMNDLTTIRDEDREKNLSGLALLRAPFPAHLISKKPRPLDKNSRKGKCSECGGYHGLPAIHLDYVGHAALTDRLLEVDPEWDWAPMATTPEGLPLFDKNGGLWIWLTVCGKTRPGYGDADGKTGGNAVKEVIGDALRNAAMRFGVALNLWHKGNLHAPADAQPAHDNQESPPDQPLTNGDRGQAGNRGNGNNQRNGNQRGGDNTQRQQNGRDQGGMPAEAFSRLSMLLRSTNTSPGVLCEHYKVDNLRMLSKEDFEDAVERLEDQLAREAHQQSNNRQQARGGDFDPSTADSANL